MITQGEIRKKALVPWNSGAFLSGRLRGETIFPFDIRFRTPGGAEVLAHFDAIRDWIQTLRRHSREARSKGYDIIWQEIAHRTLGRQKMPGRIVFSTEADWLYFIQKETQFQAFLEMEAHTRQRLPELLPYLAEHPLKALGYAAHWSDIIAVCRWFKDHPWPGKYIRQLDIAGVDTKFIETRKALWMDLLTMVLAESHFDAAISGLARHGFERKFGLKYDPPMVRLRLLDPALVRNGLSDLTLPLAELAGIDFGAQTVFITENKINGLSFPPVARAMVIFGLGYGVEMLPHLPWLHHKQIVYWGDIDTHGFAILSQVRGYFPGTRSMLMDRRTLLDHRALWGLEDPAKAFGGRPAHLGPAEAALLEDLRQNKLGAHIRLEQERIRFSALLAALREMGFEPRLE